MRIRHLAAAAFVLLVVASPAGNARAVGNCSVTSTGLVPVNDLGAAFYQGVQGGLYLGGLNQRPAAHDAAGLAIANTIAALDTFGNPDPAGRVVLISIGMSNTTQEFSHFVPKAMTNPARNPRLQVVDCAQGGQSADRILDPAAPYWATVNARLRQAGSAPAQVQAVWLKEAIAGPRGGFPAATDTLMRDLGSIVRLIEQKMPNARLCYLSSRIYAGYATGVSTLNPEPYAYESAFAVKGLIATQLAGEDSLSYANGNAPWLSWGPYLWADGLTPRSDGLTWDCADLNTDGTHPSDSGREQVADLLMSFFSTDATTVPWFLASATDVPARESDVRLAVSPNPSAGAVEVMFIASAGERWRVEILDPAGRRVALVASGTGRGGPESLRWNGRDARGEPVGAGAYWAKLELGGRALTRSFVLLGVR